jgi:hypothetical protein
MFLLLLIMNAALTWQAAPAVLQNRHPKQPALHQVPTGPKLPLLLLLMINGTLT